MPIRIGLVPMAAKPYTVGHDGLVRLAAKECDQVKLFVSLSDRYRPDEPLVSGNDMKQLWDKYIERSLPPNVTVVYGGSPVANVWKEMDAANKAGSNDTYIIYSDTEDAANNFPETTLKKYGSEIYGKGQLKVRPVARTETVDISGTKMRAALAKGDKATFMKGLPNALQSDDVWDMLYHTAKNPPPTAKRTPVTKKKKPTAESLIRAFVRAVLRG